MNLTINTDASYCTKYRVSGYGFYIICNEFKIQKAGKFTLTPANPEEAEVMALGNAIATLLSHKDLPSINFLVVNCDCVGAMEGIEYKRGVYQQVRELRNELIRRTRAKRFEFRHVKAHNNSPDARSWVNDWCDAEAKRYMRQARRELRKLQIN